MNGAENPGTGLPKARPDAPHVTGNRNQPSTLAKRLAKTKQRARSLAQTQKAKIPVRIGVPVDVHETLVEIAEKSGGQSLAKVAYRCMVDGMQRYARTLRMRVQPLDEHSFGVMDGNPELANAHRSYGTNEATARENLNAAVEKSRDELAAELHIPGRKNAAVG